MFKTGYRHRFIFLATISLFSLISSALAAGYTLSSGPYTIQDLGSPLQTNTQEHQVMYRTNDGHRHLQLYYDTFGANPMNVVDIDVDSGIFHSSIFTNNYGRPGAQCHVFFPANNKFYLASGDPGSMSEFDPSTGATRYIHALHYKGAQYCEIGDDGWIYAGEITSVDPVTHVLHNGAGLERYNPISGTWQDLGILDPSFTGPLQYAYTLGADSRYVYIGLGELPWYLAVYDTQAVSNPVTLYWADQNDTSGAVVKGSDGAWYYQRSNSTQSLSKTYKLVNGVPVEVTQVPALNAWYNHGNTVDYQAAFPSLFKTQINLDQANPNNVNNNTAIIAWQTDANPWQSVSITGLFLQPSIIKRLYVWPGQTKLLAWASQYGLVFSYDPQTGAVGGLGYPTRSLYEATFDGTNVYLSGYPASTLRYDSTRAWSLSASTVNNTSNTVNPYLLALSGGDTAGAWLGKYNYYSDKGADGLVYIGTHHERSSVGGGLGWYNPADGTSNGLRQPFLNNDVRDLLAVNNGSKIVYSSSDVSNVQGQLFVLDVATKQIERTFNPVPNNVSLDKIIEVVPGIVLGLTDAQQYYEANVLTGQVLWVKNLGGTAFPGIAPYDRRLVKGPDGFAWLFIGNNLCRIDPTDGTIQVILSNITVSSLMFNGGDLFFYGGTHISVIRNILTPLVPYGDVLGTGKIVMADASAVAKYAIGLPVTNFNAAAADVNGDGKVTLQDAVLIAQYVVGLISKFPVS